jgi:pSer/pThr/pTyr-binding forkhead associated (FHA) protein
MSAALVIAKSLKYKLEVQDKSLSIDQAVLRIGRDADNDVVLDDLKVSRHHAEIRIEKGSLYIKNVSGKNFMSVDGQVVDEKLLDRSHKIQLGDSEIKVVLESQSLTPLASVSSGVAVSGAGKTVAPAQRGPAPGQVTGSAARSTQATRGTQATNFSVPQTGSRAQFYGIIAVIGLLVVWLLSSETASKKESVDLRGEVQVQRSIEESAAAVQQLQAQQEAKGKDTLQYRMAEQHYIKGFRDYRQGQYARAMQSFQAALSFYPQHELARKYWTLSKRKFDELVQFNMNQGRRYLGKNNFRLCRNSFANVMIMLKDPKDAIYKEAKQFHDECQLKQEGVF